MRENQPTIAGFEDREGAVSQGMPVASESWKGQGKQFSPRASRRNAVSAAP